MVKLMASGGNMTPTVGPHESQFGVEEIAAALDEAHRHGLLLAVHAHGGQAIVDALEACADSIEHCTFFTEDGVDADAAVLERLARSGVAISATFASTAGADSPFPAIRIRLAAITANMTTLHGLGARLVCSSDAGVAPTKPHDVLPHGVCDALPRIGMTPFEAVASVTSLAAEVCGIGDVTGTLEPGKAADVLAVAGNLMTDLRAIHEVLAVVVGGVRLSAGHSS